MVGFAAETDDLLANAAEKLRRKGLDLIVLNDVGAPGVGMGADDNAITVLDRRRRRAHRRALAEARGGPRRLVAAWSPRRLAR